jgi:hypothetical protein
MGNDRFYLCHVGGRPYRIQKLKRPTLCRCHIRAVTGSLFFHPSGL